MSNVRPKYAAFISYRHVEADKDWAKKIHEQLERYRTPPELVEKGIPARVGTIFRDEEELEASADLSAAINAALEQSEYLIVVCSPETPKSRWVNAEVDKFRELGRHDRILTLLIAGEPADAFPPSLREIRQTVVTAEGPLEQIRSVEPLAVDVRPRRDQSAADLLEIARLRFAAALLKVSYADLYQREAKRKVKEARRLAAITAAVAAVILVLVGVAFLNWQHANASRLKQVAAEQLTAEKATLLEQERTLSQQASALAEANKQLAGEQARLAAQERIARKKAEAQEKISSELAAERLMFAEEQRALAAAKSKLAEEKTKEADEQRKARQGDRLAKFLMSAMLPEDPTRYLGATFYAPKADYSRFKVIDMMHAAERRDEIELADAPLARAAVWNLMGNMCRQFGLLSDAEKYLKPALELRKKHLSPNDRDIADSHFDTAWLYHERGKFDLAKEHYDLALGIRQKIPGSELEQAEIHQHLAWVYYLEETEESERLMDESFKRALALRNEKLRHASEGQREQLLTDIVYTKLGWAAANIGLKNYVKAKIQVTDIILHKQLEELGMKNRSDALKLFVDAHKGIVFRDEPERLEVSRDKLQQSLELLLKDRNGPVFEGAVRFALAGVLERLEQFDEAEAEYRQAFAGMRAARMFQIPRQAEKIAKFAKLLWTVRKAPEAYNLWMEYLDEQEKRFGTEHAFSQEARSAYQSFRDEFRDFAARFPAR